MTNKRIEELRRYIDDNLYRPHGMSFENILHECLDEIDRLQREKAMARLAWWYRLMWRFGIRGRFQ